MPNQFKQYIKNKIFWCIIIVFISLFTIPKFFQSHTPDNATAVETALATAHKIVPKFETVGNIIAAQTVKIIPQINAQLIKIYVKPGTQVTKDQLLFLLDDAPSQAEVKLATANLARDQAALDNASEQLQRYQKLLKTGYISKLFFDQIKSNLYTAKATVAADVAALSIAKAHLSYTKIYAPISGRLSDINYKIGDIVSTSNNVPLTVINQFQPIEAVFSVPANNLSIIWEAQNQHALEVVASSDSDKAHPVDGSLIFIDNQVDPSTGAINMKASFDNQDQVLWPGQFAKLHLLLPPIEHAILIPTIALQQNQEGHYYLYVVDKTHHAHLRWVTPGITQGEQTLITKGLNVGEKVVTRGQFEISDGSLVHLN